MNYISYEDIDLLKKGNSKSYKKVSNQIRQIVYSRLSYFKDIPSYIDDLISNGILIALRAYETYDSRKSKFSSYLYNKVVSSSKRQYLSLKYPFAGIKALSAGTKAKLEAFTQSPSSLLMSLSELKVDVESRSIDDIESLIKSKLTLLEEEKYLQTIIDLSKGSIKKSSIETSTLKNIKSLLKKGGIDMFINGSKTYKLIPSAQVLEGVFTAGYVIEELNSAGVMVSQYFSDLAKTKIIERLKHINGFKSNRQQLLDSLAEEAE